MKISRALILSALASLTLAAPAHAAPPVPGAQLCDPSSAACLTIGANDCVAQVRYDAVFQVTTYQIEQFLGIAGMPCPIPGFTPRDHPSGVAYVQTHADGSLFNAAVNTTNLRGSLAEYCNNAIDTNAKTQATGDLPARVDTPPALYAACNADPAMPHFSRYANQPVVDPAGPAPVTVAPAIAAPVSTKELACAAVALGHSRVAVTQIGMKCDSARSMIAAYLRRGIEPRGYVCVKARAGHVRSASCGKPSRAATRVTGRWRG